MCHTALGGLWTHSRKTNVIPPQPLSYSARPSSPKLLVEHGKAHRPRAILPGTDHGVVCAVRQSLRRSGFLRVNGPRHSPTKLFLCQGRGVRSASPPPNSVHPSRLSGANAPPALAIHRSYPPLVRPFLLRLYPGPILLAFCWRVRRLHVAQPTIRPISRPPSYDRHTIAIIRAAGRGQVGAALDAPWIGASRCAARRCGYAHEDASCRWLARPIGVGGD